jgi:hypothetical protein
MSPSSITSLHVEKERPVIELSVVLERRFRLERVRLRPDDSGWTVLLPGEEEGHGALFRPLGATALGSLKREILEAFQKIRPGAPRKAGVAI